MSHLAFYQTRFGTMAHRTEDQVIGRALNIYGQWAIDEIAIIFDLLGRHQHGAFLDVGSNIGTHSLAAARLFPEMRVFAYDAQAEAARIFSTNMSLNGVQNVTLRNVAVGEKSEFVRLYTNKLQADENMGAAQFRTSHIEGDSCVLLPQVALDDMHQGDAIAFIKIDIEGAELKCLRGAVGIIDLCCPIIYFENNEASSQGPIFDFLHEKGYRTFWHVSEPFDPDNFKDCAHSIYGGGGEVNILCVHPSSFALPFVEHRFCETTGPLDAAAWYRTRYLNRELKASLPYFKKNEVDSFCAALASFAMNAERDGRLDDNLEAYLARQKVPAFNLLRSNLFYGAIENIARPMLTTLLRRQVFDAASYLEQNPDVAEAVASGSIESGAEHYAMFGYFEGRA